MSERVYTLVFCSVLLLAGCANHTEYGNCVGLGEKQDARLHYKASVRNIVIGVVFSELVAPPVYVAVDEFYCPVGLESHADQTP